MITKNVQIKEAGEEAGDEEECDGTDYDEQDFEYEDDDGAFQGNMAEGMSGHCGMFSPHPCLYSIVLCKFQDATAWEKMCFICLMILHIQQTCASGS